MSLEPQSTNIDGEEYTLTPLPAMRNAKLSAKLGGIIAPAIARAGVGLGKAGIGGLATSLIDMDIADIADGFVALFEKLPPDEMEHLIRELLYSLRKGKQDVSPGRLFDLEFAGKMMTVFKLLRFAFEVNFGDFFAAGQEVAKARALRPVPSPSKESST